ncbi:hypothetical protein HLB44_32545 [Aquincola sp. S2]|uniref:Uncharacterized protein n=1 Tax=Pseudaquabacterium terrae TaxID=2732868 RepID=A0ABX2ESX1_9BURK|nr:hypothetical protein [Aquabacterium terrae]NRF71728.1 hypothetical protein [Aquabacterium terrae]
MFESNSRYLKIPTVEVENAKGETVLAVKLRRLPAVEGNLTAVAGTDRLDVIAHRRYTDGTKFWHVADANTELEASNLVEQESKADSPGTHETKFLFVPEN